LNPVISNFLSFITQILSANLVWVKNYIREGVV